MLQSIILPWKRHLRFSPRFIYFFSEFSDPNPTSQPAVSTFSISTLLPISSLSPTDTSSWCQMHCFSLRSVSLNLLLLKITSYYPCQMTFIFHFSKPNEALILKRIVVETPVHFPFTLNLCLTSGWKTHLITNSVSRRHLYCRGNQCFCGFSFLHVTETRGAETEQLKILKILSLIILKTSMSGFFFFFALRTLWVSGFGELC